MTIDWSGPGPIPFTEIGAVTVGPARMGKTEQMARLRDQLLREGSSIALISPGADGGKPHVCIVKPFRRKS